VKQAAMLQCANSPIQAADQFLCLELARECIPVAKFLVAGDLTAAAELDGDRMGEHHLAVYLGSLLNNC
jgi:hypothetical protein